MDVLADSVLDCKIHASAGVHMNTNPAFTTHQVACYWAVILLKEDLCLIL